MCTRACAVGGVLALAPPLRRGESYAHSGTHRRDMTGVAAHHHCYGAKVVHNSDIAAVEPVNPHPPENLNGKLYRGRPILGEVPLPSFKINSVNLKQDVGALRLFFAGRGGW